MAKKYRVKHYYGKDAGSYRAKPHPVVIIFIILVLGGLGYLGTVLYEPVYDFIMNIGKAPGIVESAPESVLPQPPQDDSADTAEPEPEPLPTATVRDKQRAIYIPHEIASDPTKLDEFLAGLAGTQVNSVMVDIKNIAGEVLFRSANEKAAEWGAVAENALDLKQLKQKLSDQGLGLVVKMSVFRDPIAASKGKREYAIGYRGTSYLWLDNAADAGGKPWLNPYSDAAVGYISAIALEAVDSGADMLVLENFRFPDNSSIYATFNEAEETPPVSRSEILTAILGDLTAKVEAKGVGIATFYTALEPTLLENEADRYGGPVLKIPGSILVLDVRPALFGGNYSEAGIEITDPLENPAGTVTAALNYVKQGVSTSTVIIPVLQGGNVDKFNAGRAYTAEQVAAQIDAAEALGYDEYFLYSANGVYLLK